MRPARKGPENGFQRPADTPAGRCFNEAGPQGAGKRRTRAAAPAARSASMRPARKGPENLVGAAEMAKLSRLQ